MRPRISAARSISGAAQPLADLADEPVHEAEAGQLEEQRLRAVELLHDAELALGRADELVPELERLIAAEPYREHVRAQYALALYRSGRQADALAACRAARELLVEELGVDPGPELQELERRILRHDPALAAPDGARACARAAAHAADTAGRSSPRGGRRSRRSCGATTCVWSRSPARAARARRGFRSQPRRSWDRSCATASSSSTSRAVHDPALLGYALAQALEVSETGEALEDVLAANLRDRSMLLLLDNLEQLVPDVGLVARLLAAAPRLLVLATSRTPLRLAAEHEYAVPPLAPPKPGAGLSFEELAANDAVRLFAARAAAVDPEFQLDDRNAEAVAEVCARLDGLPLAIELAAARSKLLPPETMQRRLDRALEFLVGGAQDLPGRQRTLRATLEWSHGLLSEDEATLFARLAVFAGGWTLEAAEAVCGGDGLDVFETLASLVDKSLVRPLRRPTGEPRFAMLETIREYAAELLEASGEAETVRLRHCEHILARVEEGAVAWLTGADPQLSLFPILDEEHANFRAALTWAGAAGQTELEVRLACAARWWWVVQGHLSEGRRFFDAAFEHTVDAPKELRARALVHGCDLPVPAGRLAARQGSGPGEPRPLPRARRRGRGRPRDRRARRHRDRRGGSRHRSRAVRGGGSALPEPGPSEPRRGIAGEPRHGRPHAAATTRPPSGTTREAIELSKETGDRTAPRSTFTTSRGRSSLSAGPARVWRRCARASPSRGGSATGR